MDDRGSGCVWNLAPVSLGEKRNVVTVVLLGWLGSKTKHLKRYVEWYNSRGFNAVTFVVDVREALWNFSNRAAQRVRALADELDKWVSEDGSDRCLIFHTFSNTGWFAYGEILDKFQGRHDIMNKIRGCIVDSGGGDPFNPQIYAAGICIVLLKNRNVTVEVRERKGLQTKVKEKKMQDKEFSVFEIVLMFLLKMLFLFILRLPNVNRRLRRNVSIMSKKEPDCPQLYLYSNADKVIPFQSIESHMEELRSLGIRVHSFNFGSSSHVDHFRIFSDTYSSLLYNFLEDFVSSQS